MFLTKSTIYMNFFYSVLVYIKFWINKPISHIGINIKRSRNSPLKFGIGLIQGRIYADRKLSGKSG
jgi:hypothetical protein